MWLDVVSDVVVEMTFFIVRGVDVVMVKVVVSVGVFVEFVANVVIAEVVENVLIVEKTFIGDVVIFSDLFVETVGVVTDFAAAFSCESFSKFSDFFLSQAMGAFLFSFSLNFMFCLFSFGTEPPHFSPSDSRSLFFVNSFFSSTISLSLFFSTLIFFQCLLF